MRQLFLAFISMALLSCNPAINTNGEEINGLKREVATLRYQMDSLLLVSKTSPTPIVQTKTSKPKTTAKAKKKAVPPGSQTLYTAAPSYTPPEKSRATYSGQCQAITKKGYQCSRSSRSGGYCWQHGG